MANDKIIATRNLFFGRILNYLIDNPTDDELTAWAADLFSIDIANKIDKILTATEDNFATFDDAGGIKDSLLNEDSFAPKVHDHDGVYIRENASDSYDARANKLTFIIDGTHTPILLSNPSGDEPLIITDWNADLLDGLHADAFFPANGDFDTRYYKKTEIDTFIDGLLPVITTGGAPTLNIVLAAVDGLTVSDSGVALDELATVAALADYYTKTEMIASLLLKMNIHQGSTYGSGILPVYNGTDNNVISSTINISALATVAALAGYYAKVGGSPAVNNFPAFDTGNVLKDSTYNSGSFAPIAHSHTALPNDLQINTSEFVVSFISNTPGGTPSSNGYATIKANGAQIKVLTTA
jgi:hypothetical protein